MVNGLSVPLLTLMVFLLAIPIFQKLTAKRQTVSSLAVENCRSPAGCQTTSLVQKGSCRTYSNCHLDGNNCICRYRKCYYYLAPTPTPTTQPATGPVNLFQSKNVFPINDDYQFFHNEVYAASDSCRYCESGTENVGNKSESECLSYSDRSTSGTQSFCGDGCPWGGRVSTPTPTVSQSPSPTCGPTSTPGPEPTPTGGATLYIKASFEGSTTSQSPMLVTLKTKDTDFSKTVVLSEEGESEEIILEGLSVGQSYEFLISSFGFLTNKQPLTLSTGRNPASGFLDFGTLKSGDLNDDNQINGLDWSWMKLNYGENGEE